MLIKYITGTYLLFKMEAPNRFNIIEEVADVSYMSCFQE